MRWQLVATTIAATLCAAGIAPLLGQVGQQPPRSVPAPEASGKQARPASAKGDKTLVRKAAKPVREPNAIAAKSIFGAIGTPAPMAARAIGFYAKGCLAGAKPLAIDGPNWQAMRLSRNRNWGHPDLIALIERLARDAKANDGWPGLLVGDISQPRGGPMLTGHNSHQIGLDADIWLTPMPDRRLSAKEREDLPATSMLAPDGIYVDPKVWTVSHARLVLRAASYPEVERVLVHPGIKMALCQQPGASTAALAKIRPYFGHHYHMHVRIACPRGSEGCEGQQPIPNPNDDGCGKEIDDWIKLLKRPPAPPVPGAKPPPPKPPLTLDQLPAACRLVVNAGQPSSALPPVAVPVPTPAAPPPALRGVPLKPICARLAADYWQDLRRPRGGLQNAATAGTCR